MRYKLPIILLLLGLILPTLGILGFMLNALDNGRLATQQQLETSFRTTGKRSINQWIEQQRKYLSSISDLNDLSSIVESELYNHQLVHGLRISNTPNLTVFPVPNSKINIIKHSRYKKAQKEEFIEKNYIAAHRKYLDIRTTVSSALEYDFLTLSALRCSEKGMDPAQYIQDLTQAFLKTNERSSGITEYSIEIAFMVIQKAKTHPELSSLTLKASSYISTNLQQPSEQIGSGYRTLATKKFVNFSRGKKADFPWMALETASLNYLTLSREEQKTYLNINRLSEWSFSSDISYGLINLKALELHLNDILREGLSSDSISVIVNPKDLPKNELLVLKPTGFSPEIHIHIAWKDSNYIQDLSNTKYLGYILTAITIISIISASSAYVFFEYRKQQRYNEFKNDIVATVSHELVTPLTSTRLLLDNLSESTHLEPQKTREYLDILYKENLRLSQLVNNFLTYSRMERNKLKFYFEQTDIGKFAEKIVYNCKERFPGKNIEINLTIESSTEVNIDQEMMEIALLNIIDNGKKYSLGNAKIDIIVTSDHSACHISIKDQGIGMSKQTQARIFNKFYRLDKKLNRTTEGVGLGLSIVQSILKSHKATIEVESTLGKGSTFTVTLPLGRV